MRKFLPIIFLFISLGLLSSACGNGLATGPNTTFGAVTGTATVDGVKLDQGFSSIDSPLNHNARIKPDVLNATKCFLETNGSAPEEIDIQKGKDVSSKVPIRNHYVLKCTNPNGSHVTCGFDINFVNK